MSRALLLAAVLGLSNATPAAASFLSDSFLSDTVTVIGGTQSCGNWMASRRARGSDVLQQEFWVIGYLSGVAVGSLVGGESLFLNPLKGVDAETVWAWMDDYCRAHPLVTVQQAIGEFVGEHPGRPDLP